MAKKLSGWQRFAMNCVIIQFFHFLILNLKIFSLLRKNEKEAHSG